MGQENAVVYVRVSTKDQDEKYSPDVQLDNCRSYASRKGLKIIKEFREARSGWKPNDRAEFSNMLDFIRERGTPNVIYAFADRLSRNTEDYVLLKSLGTALHNAISGISFSPNNPDDYDQTAGFEHDLVEAKRFSARLSKRVVTAQLEKAKRGEYPGAPPLGYLPVPQLLNGKWKNKTILDPDRAHLIKKMFELYSTGEYSLRQITDRMKNLGLRSKSGRVLLLDEIRRYLRTHFYYGTFKWGDKLYPNKATYEPLISKALFTQVQEVLDGKRVFTKRGKDFKYKGLLTCDLCGCAMVGDDHSKILKSTGEKQAFIYYRCTGGKRSEYYQEHFGKPKCPLYYGPYFTEQEIDRYFEEAISSLYVDPDTYKWVQEQLEDDYQNLKEMNEEEVRNLKREYSRILTNESFVIQRMPTANPLVQVAFERELENHEIRKAEIDARIEQLEKGEEAISREEIRDTLELSKALKDNYLAASPEKRRKLNKLMFITVNISYKDRPVIPSGQEEYITVAPFHFVWNEPFKSLWEIGFIQGMAETEAEEKVKEKAAKSAVLKKWRGRRDSNSRPPA